jgi:hypothetical protein
MRQIEQNKQVETKIRSNSFNNNKDSNSIDLIIETKTDMSVSSVNSSNSNKNLNALLTCPICFVRFDTKVNMPKILPCSQTICLMCIRYYADEEDTFMCNSSMCKKRHKIPDDEFVTNQFVVDLILLENMKNQESPIMSNDDKLMEEESYSNYENSLGDASDYEKEQVLDNINEIAAKLTCRIENAYEKYIYDLKQSNLYLNNHFNKILNKIDESFEIFINKITSRRNHLYRQINVERDMLIDKLKFSEERFNDFNKEYSTILDLISESTKTNEITNELLIRAKIFVDRVNYLSKYVKCIEDMASKQDEFVLSID